MSSSRSETSSHGAAIKSLYYLYYPLPLLDLKYHTQVAHEMKVEFVPPRTLHDI
jgi:hypothetical protein